MLKSAVLFSAVGAAIILGVDGLVRAVPSASGGGSTSKAPSPAPSSGEPSTSSDSITVKVMYFGMPLSVTNSREELFVLQSPAYFHDLLSNVVEKHPVLSAMIPTMMIFVDGVPGQPSMSLKDGDEVDLVPASVGG
jgi:molybdopterin converting factor small subunit